MRVDAVDSVRPGAVETIGELEAGLKERQDVEVEVVVDEVELLCRWERASSAVDRAREAGVGGVVRILPHHLELREDELLLGIDSLVRAFVEEHDEALAGGDELAQGGPVIAGHDG